MTERALSRRDLRQKGGARIEGQNAMSREE